MPGRLRELLSLLRDLMLERRDRILGDRRFQLWAARFPLTRPIARRNTRALFDLCAGFVYAQVLAACVELDLFNVVGARPLRRPELARRCAMPTAALDSLLDAAIALRLLGERRGGRIGLGAHGAALRGNPGITAMITHHAMLYHDLADPVGLLRRPGAATRLGAYWSYAAAAMPATLGPAQVAEYTRLMAASQPLIADEVLAAHDFRRHGCLLDVGGGDGSFLAAVARQAPGLRLMLVDLPPVAALAQARLEAAGIAARCIGGDIRTEALPGGADLISLVRVLHDHDDAAVRRLLAAAHAALPAGGSVLVAEPMADDASAAAYFNLYLHAMGSGRPRRAAELMAMLREAGFERPVRHRTPTPLLARVITARRS